MAKLKDLKVSIGLSSDNKSKLDAGLKGVQQQFKTGMGKVQNVLKNAGRAMTMAITAPLVIMATKAVQAFNEQAKAIAQVEAGLKSTGNQVGYTSKQLQQMASNLQNKTLFGDEEILKDATAQLLTFTNIAGENFQKTQAIALDLATRLDGDLKGASIMLGKALNDPVANLSALSRAGIQFSDDQKEVIKSMAETGRLGEAQALILEELQKQYGGSAEAAAKAGTGPFKQLSNSLGDLQEQFGKLILEFLTPLVPKVKSVLNAFLNLSEGTKRSIVMVAGVLGAAGPLALAVSALVPLFGALLSPIGLVVAAIVALAYVTITNFAEIEKAVVPVINDIIIFQNKTKALSVIAQIVGDAFVRQFRNVGTAAKVVARSIKGIGQALELVSALEFGKAGDVLKDAFSDSYEQIIENSKENGRRTKQALQDGLDAKDIELIEVGALTAKVVEFKGKLRSMFSASGPGGNVEVPVDLTPAVTKVSTAGLAEISIADELLDEEHIDTLVSSYEKQMDRVKFATENVGKVMGHIGGAVDAVFANIRDKSMGFHLYMKQMLMDLLQRLIKLVATYAALSLFLGPAGMAKAFGKGGLKGFLVGGMGLGGDVPGFASGGLVTGPTLGLIGEGAGTSMSNPEVIAPLDKLQSMIGGSAVTVTGRLDGRDILISSERAGFDRNRVRGF